MSQDVVVYEHEGTHYVANFTEDGWLSWPAEQNGWQRRRPCAPSLADACSELPPRNAWLALRLSGVTDDGQ